MAQFKVYENSHESGAERYPYVLDVQHEIVSSLETRLVIPLVSDLKRMTKLNPVFEIEGRVMILSTTEMASVPLDMIGKEVADLSERSGEIINAIDFLITGF